MNPESTIAVLPGDGIGPEVVREAKKILQILESRLGWTFRLAEAPVGGAGFEAAGHPLPPESLKTAKEADAVLLGAVGGPKWDKLEFRFRPERALLGLRKEMELFANLRPAKVFPALAGASTLKLEVVEGLDIMVVRELIGGIYFGEPRGVETGPDGKRKGFNTLVYTEPEIERIARIAFETAQKRNNKVTSVDKANVLESTGLWREVVIEVHADYPGVSLDHMYVDNAAMQLVRAPKQFDVIVTTNMFGDILSDEASMLTGSIGMLPSASLGTRHAMYEPIHGSAPDIAGKDIANPLATILSVGMMFKHSFNRGDVNEWIEGAVGAVLDAGYRTGDIMSKGMKRVGTVEMGDRVAAELEPRIQC
ncbi:MAG: 3-isopropylmalate dehydrogenase [Nitrospinae bacterium CG11_big_fil_rev_8_21_14_0_20_56_8]|nr:MAG: 3-isopropylmalate dehydrogenase [Nitrospinae bacterium CG11_big_fil_rev_8_21_14_0_20_56_8]